MKQRLDLIEPKNKKILTITFYFYDRLIELKIVRVKLADAI